LCENGGIFNWGKGRKFASGQVKYNYQRGSKEKHEIAFAFPAYKFGPAASEYKVLLLATRFRKHPILEFVETHHVGSACDNKDAGFRGIIC
jgi:hypothetical protein